MKKIILLLAVLFLFSGCYVVYREPMYQVGPGPRVILAPFSYHYTPYYNYFRSGRYYHYRR